MKASWRSKEVLPLRGVWSSATAFEAVHFSGNLLHVETQKRHRRVVHLCRTVVAPGIFFQSVLVVVGTQKDAVVISLKRLRMGVGAMSRLDEQSSAR